MNRSEKEQIRNLPSQYKPLGAWAYLGYTILFNIPVIGFIMLIVFSCNSSNINRRSFARSYLCALIIVGIIVAIVSIFAGSYIKIIIDTVKEYFQAMMASMK